MRRMALVAAMALALGAATPAGAQGVEQARTLFVAGAQAYEAGQFPAAIQAFEEAYKLAPRDAIIFSIAQAYKRQYYIDKKPENLRMALKRYREYLAKVPTGGRSADAAQAITELEPQAAQLAATTETAQPPAAAMPTRLMVSSRTTGARVSVDGGSMQDLPLIAEVKPGKHRIKVVAEGRFDEDREIVAAEGGVVALDIPLRDKPARITFALEDGAQIAIDGRPVGTTPMAAPVDVPAGLHLLTITKNGRRPEVEEIELDRGEQRQIRKDLKSTGQRAASYIVMSTGAAALLAGTAFTVMAFRQQSEARDIEAEARSGNIPPERIDDHNNAIRLRDRWRVAAGISLGSGVALGATGVLLYAFDQPSVQAPTMRSRAEKDRPQEAPAGPSLEISATPTFGPGSCGGAVGVRF
jgi:tetratricopeptide (TPR) repeat protein